VAEKLVPLLGRAPLRVAAKFTGYIPVLLLRFLTGAARFSTVPYIVMFLYLFKLFTIHPAWLRRYLAPFPGRLRRCRCLNVLRQAERGCRPRLIGSLF